MACFTGKGADGNPAKWRWLPVKQSGSKPSPRCSMSAVVAPGNHGVMFGGVYDEVNGFKVWVLFLLIVQTWLRSASEKLNSFCVRYYRYLYTSQKLNDLCVRYYMYVYTYVCVCLLTVMCKMFIAVD